MNNVLAINRNTVNYLVKDIFDTVLPDTSKRFTCPKCGGENSFSVSNTRGKFIFNCFRNSCDLRGYHGYIPTSQELIEYLGRNIPADKPNFKLQPHIKLSMGTSKALEYVVKHNSLKAYSEGLYTLAYDKVQDRLLYLLEDDKKAIRGAVGKSLCRGAPKTLIYPNSAIMPLIIGINPICVIVEDCTSAATIASNTPYTGFALLGTVFKQEYLPYLVNYSKIIIALDPDAKKKAIEIQSLIKLFKRDVTIWHISKDIKDMDKDEIAQFIG